MFINPALNLPQAEHKRVVGEAVTALGLGVPPKGGVTPLDAEIYRLAPKTTLHEGGMDLSDVDLDESTYAAKMGDAKHARTSAEQRCTSAERRLTLFKEKRRIQEESDVADRLEWEARMLEEEIQLEAQQRQLDRAERELNIRKRQQQQEQQVADLIKAQVGKTFK